MYTSVSKHQNMLYEVYALYVWHILYGVYENSPFSNAGEFSES